MYGDPDQGFIRWLHIIVLLQGALLVGVMCILLVYMIFIMFAICFMSDERQARLQGTFDQLYDRDEDGNLRRDLNTSARRSGIHSMAKYFPYSGLLSREGGECPICLEEFKEKDANGNFRGGPAYYMSKGLKNKKLAVTFSVCLFFGYGFVFSSVQANSITSAFNWSTSREYLLDPANGPICTEALCEEYGNSG